MRSTISSSTVTVLLILLLTIGLFPDLASFVFRLPLRPFTRRPRAEKACEPSLGSPAAAMSWLQKSFALPARSRGSYLVTDHVEANLPELRTYRVGLLHLFVQHTSCALSLNENWDEDVRADMSDALDRIAPEDRKGNLYRHSAEGPDDMPVSFDQLSQNVQRLSSNSTPSAGTHQVSPDRSIGQHTHQGWQTGDRHLAGYMVSRVQDVQAYPKGGGNHTGGEDLGAGTFGCAGPFMVVFNADTCAQFCIAGESNQFVS